MHKDWTYLLDEYKRYLKYEKHYSIHTVTSYMNDLYDFRDYMIQHLNIIDIKTIKPKQVRSWLASLLQQEYEIKSIKRKKSSIQSFFKYYVINNYIQVNPVVGIPTPPLPKSLPKTINDEAIEIIINLEQSINFNEEWDKINEKIIVSTFFSTGIRRSELKNIQIKDIDISRGNVLVFGKGNKERMIPLHPDLISIIIQYIEHRPKSINEHPNLFVLKNGEPIYEQYIYRIVKKYLIKNTTASQHSPHVLRHSFATTLLNNGADLMAIKELLGHSSIAATQIYTHVNIESLKKEFRKSHPRS